MAPGGEGIAFMLDQGRLLVRLPGGGCPGNRGPCGILAGTTPGSVTAPLLLVQLAVSGTKPKLSTFAITPEQCQPGERQRSQGTELLLPISIQCEGFLPAHGPGQ